MVDFQVESFIVGFSIATVLFISYNIADFLEYWKSEDSDD